MLAAQASMADQSAKTFELACVRVCFDIDRAEADREPHRCRHGLPGLAERRQRDTVLSPDQERLLSLEL